MARALGYALLDIDDIRAEVDKVSGIGDWERRGWLAYDILKGLVEKQMRLGVSVIVDTPLTHQWLRDFLFGVAEACGAAVHVVCCHCSDAVAIERNRARLAREPERYAGRDAENFHRIKGLFQPIEAIASVRVNTEEAVGENVARVLGYLGRLM